MTEAKYDPKTRDLAEKIYCGLVTEAVEATKTSVEMTADPTNLAKVSFKLAAAFHAVENGLNADNLPKNQDFKVGIDDIMSWNKG